MDIIPAIDIKDGRCVRLFQGDYDRETVFSDSPVDMATHWVEQGATRLHVVDLDGAKQGIQTNLSIVREIVSTVQVPVQYGGGIRDVESVEAILSSGIDRVIVGTAAIETPEIIEEMLTQFGNDFLVISIDARGNKVALHGWTTQTQITTSDVIQKIDSMGIRRFIYTDISRDGTLTEPNFDSVQDLIDETNMDLLVAGGVSTLGHICRLKEIQVGGVILGTAIYTGNLDLKAAIEVSKN